MESTRGKNPTGAPLADTGDSVRATLVNSVVAAVLGAGLMVLAHELVHLVTGLALGYPGKLFAFGVQHDGNPSPVHVAIMAAAAPVFSLVTGLIMAAWLPLRRIGGFAHLLWLWFAFTSIMEGVGYLVITPFGAGDTAETVRNLGWPSAAAIALCVVGVGLQFLAARLFAPHVGRHAGDDTGPKGRQWALAFWPWVIGSVVNIGLALAYLNLARADFGEGAAFAIVAAATATLVFAPMSFIFQRSFDKHHEPLRLKPVPIIGLVAIVALVVFNLAISGGLHVG